MSETPVNNIDMKGCTFHQELPIDEVISALANAATQNAIAIQKIADIVKLKKDGSTMVKIGCNEAFQPKNHHEFKFGGKTEFPFSAQNVEFPKGYDSGFTNFSFNNGESEDE